jgi:hypothetical protein
VIKADDGNIDFRGLFGRDTEDAAATAESAAAQATAAPEPAANTLLAAATATEAAPAATATAAAEAAGSATSNLSQNRHTGERLGQLQVNRLLCLIGDEDSRGTIAFSNELDVDLAVFHRLEEFDCASGR